jgi:hypothetical protein
MTAQPVSVLVQMTIPRMLTDQFATPAEVKSYLLAQGVWPERVQIERWRLNTVTPGYAVELEISVPLPAKPAKEPA